MALMRRVGLKVLMALVLAICFACPLLETFDRWDHTLKSGRDTESSLVIVALCVGASLLLQVAAGAPAQNASRIRTQAVASLLRSTVPLPVGHAAESPPPVPLRI